MNGAAIMMCYMVAIKVISWKLHTFVGCVNSLSTFHTIASENHMLSVYMLYAIKFCVWV